MPKKLIATTDEFYAAVEVYRKKRNFKTWQQGLLELAAMGLLISEQVEVQPYKQWGGAGKGETKREDGLNLERIELRLRGLPPLVDDDEGVPSEYA